MILLPIGHDESSVRRLPWVTLGVMALCALVLLAASAGEESFYARWGFTPARASLGGLVSHLFVHAGWLHLLSNLFLLFLAGPAIEDRWGRPLFAAFFLTVGAGSALFHGAITTQPELPLVGASGAIAGVLGACLVRYWSSSIRFAYWGLWMKGTFWAPTWLILPLWFASELLMGWLTHDLGGGGVAYWAHVGGFALGVGLALLIRSRQVEERYIHPAIESKITVSCNPVVEEALNARAAGDEERAYGLLAHAVREHGDDPDLVGAFWDVARARGRLGPAGRALVALVTRSLAAGDRELAVRLWQEGAEGGLEQHPAPATLLQLVLTLLERGQSRWAGRALDQALAARDLTPALALDAVECARSLDPEATLRAARRALELRLDVVKRDRMRRLVAELSGAEEPTLDPRVARSLGDTPRFIGIKKSDAVPTALEADALVLELADRRGVRLSFERIDGVAVAAVRGLAEKPVLILDLLANARSLDDEMLRVVRLRSDQFDPRELVAGEETPVAGFRALAARLLEATGGLALPERDAVLGQPFRHFDDLETYEREVLGVS